MSVHSISAVSPVGSNARQVMMELWSMSMLPRVNGQIRYHSQDIMVNSVGSSSLNQSYRNINQPIHVEPAAKLQLSPAALSYLQNNRP